MYTATSMLSKARNNAIYGKIHDNNKQYYRNVYLRSEHWQNLRQEKLDKNPRCERCGSYLSLDAHHKEYHNLYDVLIKDLETLCRLCHNKEHENKNLKKDKKLKRISKRQHYYDKGKESEDYLNLRAIFHNSHPNIPLIKWILEYILYESYFEEMEKDRSKHLSKWNKKRQEEFDKKYKEERRDMNNYISIHY